MIRKLMTNTFAAAGCAALLILGGCATNDAVGDNTDISDDIAHVRQSDSVVPAPGPAVVDSDGNVYSSSSVGGAGNAAMVGTNTNVTVVPEKSRVEVREEAVVTTPVVTPVEVTTVEPVVTEPVVVERETRIVETVPAPTTRVETRERVETTTVPMTSATQETTTETRTRMRKD